MKHGDLSSHIAPILAFNVDNLLFETPIDLDDSSLDLTFMEKAVERLSRVFSKPELDFRFRKMLIDIWYLEQPFTIYLFTRKRGKDRDALEELLYEKDYRFSGFRDICELREMQFYVANQCMYFFDTDKEYLVSLGTNNARHISEVGRCIGLGYSFP